MRKLFFRYDAFNFFCQAFNAISNSSVRLDGHMLDDRINRRLLKSLSALRSLNLVKDVVV